MTIEHVVNLEHHRNAPRIHFQYGIFERLFGKFRRPAPGEPTPPPVPSGGEQGSGEIQRDESVDPQPPAPPIEPVDRGDDVRPQ
jgi:hypothetical protein